MWNFQQTDIQSRFPHFNSSGTNGVAVLDTVPLSSDWKKRIADLEAIRKNQDDWDGQGAEAASPDLLDSATSLAQFLCRQKIDAPSCVVPGVNGTVIFEWQSEDGFYLEVEVTAPNQAEGCLIVPGKPAEYWTLQ